MVAWTLMAGTLRQPGGQDQGGTYHGKQHKGVVLI